MAKSGIRFENTIRPLLAEAANAEGWTLCIGAGTSSPVFPSWLELSKRLFDGALKDTDVVNVDTTFQSLSSRYSPDAILEACKDRLGLCETDFDNLLVERLYSTAAERMDAKEYQTFVDCLASPVPGKMSDSKWKSFRDVISKHLASTSAFRLSAPVYKACLTNVGPRAILSFNAEPLFFALLNFELWNQLWIQGSNRSRYASPKALFRIVARSLSANIYGRIPYYFIHGLLPVPNLSTKRKGLSAEDKLVFTESSYLSLANSVYSWQAATFLHTCASTKVVFVGVSLSDTNMRRWLAWVHTNRLMELNQLGKPDQVSTHHIWINTTKPTHEAQWLESLVAPLGVRIIWIPDWGELTRTMNLLLGL